jgi:hypothetical protein
MFHIFSQKQTHFLAHIIVVYNTYLDFVVPNTYTKLRSVYFSIFNAHIFIHIIQLSEDDKYQSPVYALY